MVKRSLDFSLFWCWIGGLTGTIVLLLILNPWENVLLEWNYSRGTINWVFTGFILIWLYGNTLITLWFDQFLTGTRSRVVTHLLGFSVVVIIFSLFVMGKSGPFGVFRGEVYTVADRFEFGPYPDEPRIIQLKNRGFEGIITLLSPSIPFENVLLKRERQRTSKHGIKLVETPMLPWISSNVKSLEKIRKLVRNSNKQYYIHCYLGKHRVSLARQTILDAAGIKIDSTQKALPKKLERGAITILNPDLALGPLPTPEEWWALTNVQTRRVISLLPPESDFGESEVALNGLAKADLFEHLALTVETIDDARKVVQEIESTHVRTYVMGFRGNDWRLELVRRVLSEKGKTNPDPLGVVPDHLERGRISQIQEGIYAGPYPTEEEFRSKLIPAGIKSIINLMDDSSGSARNRIRHERNWAKRYGLKFIHVNPIKIEEFDLSSVISDQPLYLHDFNRGKRLKAFLEVQSGKGSLQGRTL